MDIKQPESNASKMESIISTIQQLSLAREQEAIIDIVKRESRRLVGSDGVAFVLRDGDLCYYVDENAIGPLWKGKRFPMSACISGWSMLNKQVAVIEDIYKDDRIPVDAYRPTFVKSLVMVPIRCSAPIGAIGNYWASHHKANEFEVKILQALADSTSIALENVELFNNLKHQLTESERLANHLKSTLSEKEILMKEIFHRVKNNLQIISSLLNLQSNSISDEAVKAKLADSITRINSMSLVHEMLYKSENMERVLLRDYVESLMGYLHKISEEDVARIKPVCQVDNITLSLDYAIPCGLILNELITNVFKHAFIGGRSGEIILKISKHNDQIEMSVKDNGVGMPRKHAESKKTTLGLSLVERLTSQIRGQLQMVSGNGTEIKIIFPYHGADV